MARMDRLQDELTNQLDAWVPSGQAGVPKEDIDAYGPELIDAVRRWARAEVLPELNRLRDEQFGASDRAARLAKAAQDEARSAADMVAPLVRQLRRLQDEVRELREGKGQHLPTIQSAAPLRETGRAASRSDPRSAQHSDT